MKINFFFQLLSTFYSFQQSSIQYYHLFINWIHSTVRKIINQYLNKKKKNFFFKFEKLISSIIPNLNSPVNIKLFKTSLTHHQHKKYPNLKNIIFLPTQKFSFSYKTTIYIFFFPHFLGSFIPDDHNAWGWIISNYIYTYWDMYGVGLYVKRGWEYRFFVKVH